MDYGYPLLDDSVYTIVLAWLSAKWFPLSEQWWPLAGATSLATLAQRAPFGTTADVRDFYAEGGGQIDLMILLLHEDLANLFRHRVFSKRLALSDAIAVIANGFVLVIEIVSEHVFRIFRRAHRFGSDRRHLA